MKFITSNNKKLVALAAVVILCAACLVTVAYAYNAEYKDSVEQISITPSETSKYTTSTVTDSVMAPMI